MPQHLAVVVGLLLLAVEHVVAAEEEAASELHTAPFQDMVAVDIAFVHSADSSLASYLNEINREVRNEITKLNEDK